MPLSLRLREELQAELIVLKIQRDRFNKECDKRAEAVRLLLAESLAVDGGAITPPETGASQATQITNDQETSRLASEGGGQ